MKKSIKSLAFLVIVIFGTTFTSLFAFQKFSVDSSVEVAPEVAKPFPAISDSAIYMMGGAGVSPLPNGYRNDIYKSTDGVSWQLISPNSSEVSATKWGKRATKNNVVYFNGMFWLLGSQDCPVDGPVFSLCNPATNQIWYSRDGISWNQAPTRAPWVARRDHGVIVFNNKLWVIGGQAGQNNQNARLNDVWSSSDGIFWSQAPRASWSARSEFETVVFNNKLWIFGGFSVENNAIVNKKDVWSSVDGISWNLETDNAPWGELMGPTVSVFNNQMFLLGGIGLNGNVGGKVWSSYDGIKWDLVSSNPSFSYAPYSQQANGRLTSAVFQKKLWVFGGSHYNNNVQDVWSSTDGVSWQQNQVDDSNFRRASFDVVVVGQ